MYLLDDYKIIEIKEIITKLRQKTLNTIVIVLIVHLWFVMQRFKHVISV